MAFASDEKITVLREMVRLAENRRKEELEQIERVNRYNLALIAFSGSFLSLLVTAKFPILTVQISGFFLGFSVVASLIALRPRVIRGGTLVIDEDVAALREGKDLTLSDYLLVTSDLTDKAGTSAAALSHQKKWWTQAAAICLALALALTYYLYAYA
jgi:hypothetical protein